MSGTCVAPTCAHAAPYCHNASIAGVRARQVCPVTCGCDAPRSALALSKPSSGCGEQCARSGRYLAARKQLPCSDVSAMDPK